MTIHMHRYLEITAPITETRSLLAEQPPLNATRQGQWWRWADELWQIDAHPFDDRVLWRGTCVAVPYAHLFVSATLHDAGIATHITLHVAVDLGGWWQQRRVRRKIEKGVEQAIAELGERAAERCPAPVAPADLPHDPNALADALRSTHPHTVAAFEAMNAVPNLQTVAQLDQRWQATEAGSVAPDVYRAVATLPSTQADFDLIYAGGGLGLLHAAVMARRFGSRVLVFDRGEIGCAHREWNISDRELRALIEIGLFTTDELEQVVMRRYRDGVVRFSPDRINVRPAELHLPDVLNVALDATALLQIARRKLHGAGGIILDHRSFERVLVQESGKLAVEVSRSDGGRECYGGRVLLDGMGATSPLALQRFAGQPFAGVCPTVGTVVTGLEHGDAPDQHNPDLGDILVSIADAQRDRQLIWEGFPGRDDELTVYVFYYDVLRRQASGIKHQLTNEHHRPQSKIQNHSLLDLFEDYFRLLPTYKRPGADFRHVKPVYGFIPSRHTQRRQTVPMLPGVLPVGDSSAQQSPLTFCGFGSHVRNLDRTTSLLDHALRHDLLAPDQLGNISAYQANVALNWVFSRFMQPWNTARDVNQLQNVFARVLNEIGVDVAVRFFQDQMTWRDYGRIVNHTLGVYKPIIPTALRVLGPRDTARWITDWLRFSGAAATAALGRRLGPTRLDALQTRLDTARPALGFALRSRRAEWRAMGWDRETV